MPSKKPSTTSEPAREIDLILATDAEQILGLGDWGVGGIEVSIGKLAIYTAAGGIDPARVIPVMLDVGTNRESLLDDPLYIGNRHARVRGERYDAFIDAYVGVVTKLFPHALLQWEDFAPGNGRRILEKYRDRICIFNDDMQGTGAITLAAAISAVRVCGVPLRHQRIVIFGAGTAGIGVADQLRDAIVREGLSRKKATRQFWCVDRHGLLTSAMGPDCTTTRRPMPVRPPRAKAGCTNAKRHRSGGSGSPGEADDLIGSSTVPGAFTEAIVRDMAAHTERPIIFRSPIPRAQAEAKPADLIAWTEGRALIATGSAFSPVTYKGMTYVIGQINNCHALPRAGFGSHCFTRPPDQRRHVRRSRQRAFPAWWPSGSRGLLCCRISTICAVSRRRSRWRWRKPPRPKESRACSSTTSSSRCRTRCGSRSTAVFWRRDADAFPGGLLLFAVACAAQPQQPCAKPGTAAARRDRARSRSPSM